MKLPVLTSPRLAVLAGIALISPAFAAVSIDWVTIGDPGNAAQSAANRTHSFGSGGDNFGAVDYTYRIARDQTTIAQYTAFLNAVATTDTYNLYNTSMATDGNIAGISRSGSSGSYTYSVIGSGNRPITFVSWFDAARFTNWLHNGQPTGSQNAGTTENGAYTLNGATSGNAIARNVGATVWIPTENEWFKAAYYDPTHMSGAGGYWLHANQSNSMTSNDFDVAGAANYRAGDFATTPGNNIYSSSQNYLTDVGAYGPDSQSYYGLNDMAGNVWEWNDLDAESGSSRGLRGGAWFFNEITLRSSFHLDGDPSNEDTGVGFRVASVPEPSALVLTILFGTALVTRRKR